MLELLVKLDVSKDLNVSMGLNKHYTPHLGYEEIEEKAAAGLESTLGILFEKAFQIRGDKISRKLKEGKLEELYAEAGDFLLEQSKTTEEKIKEKE